MPKPMICLFAPLRKYLELFRPCFSHRQWKYFVTILLGLSQHKGRHTLKGLLASVWDQVSLSGLSRLLGLWSWSPEKLAQTWQADFRQEMAAAVQAEYRCQRAERPKHRGRPKATPRDRLSDHRRMPVVRFRPNINAISCSGSRTSSARVLPPDNYAPAWQHSQESAKIVDSRRIGH